ncbi:MAG: CDP-alcohol phosphatidyltransferase family protein [Acidobacteriota bacterium]
MPKTFAPRYLVPNAASAANLICGFCAMLAAARGAFEIAVYLLLAAVLLDLTDGRLARALNATSKFGQEVDSFCDALSFCAAPALLVYLAVLQPLGFMGGAVAVVYLLAGVFRLARFNLTADVHEKASRTMGVPTPIGAGYLMMLALMRAEIPAPAGAAVVLVIAALMLSRWQLPELNGKSVVSVMLLVGLINYLAVVWRPGWPTVIWWNLWNVLIVLAARWRDRRAPLPAR